MEVETMKPFLIVVLLLMACSSEAAVYRVTGSNYEVVNGPNYATDMRVQGWLEFADVLPANGAMVDDEVIAYQFEDGVKTLDQNNSEIFFEYFYTNEDGMPLIYSIKVLQSPVSNVLGEPVSGIELVLTLNTEGFDRYEAGYTGPCLAVGPTTHCFVASTNEDAGLFFNPGPGGAIPPEWVLLRGATQSVPVNNHWVMLLLLVLMGALTHKHWRIRR